MMITAALLTMAVVRFAMAAETTFIREELLLCRRGGGGEDGFFLLPGRGAIFPG